MLTTIFLMILFLSLFVMFIFACDGVAKYIDRETYIGTTIAFFYGLVVFSIVLFMVGYKIWVRL